MRLEGSINAKQSAKQLRRAMTQPEVALWIALRRNAAGLRFRRQHAAGVYALDFYCAPAKLAIEVDGEAHNMGDRPIRDARRDAWLASQEIRVLRYSAAEVTANLDGVMTQILNVTENRLAPFDRRRRPPPSSPPAPPPPGGGGA